MYAYLYKDPESNIPRYAGKGKGNRAYSHWRYGNKDNKVFNGWLQNLKEKHTQPIIEIYNVADEELALSLEIWFIAKYGRLDKDTGTLFNHTDGGDKPPSRKGVKMGPRSKESIDKWRKSRAGWHPSEEQRKKQSETMMGKSGPNKDRKFSEETKEKMSISAKNKPPISEETREKFRKWIRPKKEWNDLPYIIQYRLFKKKDPRVPAGWQLKRGEYAKSN